MKFQTPLFVATFIALLTVCPFNALAAQETDEQTRALNEHLIAFSHFVGTWVCEDSWEGGSELWAQNDYSIGMNGNFFEATTSTKNPSGGVYERYKTTWVYNAKEKRLESYGFTYDGTITVTYPEIDKSGEGHPVIRSKWQQAEGTFIKQEVQMNADKESYSWRVWSSSDDKDWTQMMDGTWKKQG